MDSYLFPLEVITTPTLDPAIAKSHKEIKAGTFASFLMSGRVFLQQMSKTGEGIKKKKTKTENMEIKLIAVALDTITESITETYHMQSRTLS